MASGVRIEVIRDTQKILGKHVKKPQLTEKLLQKPPFRFLHDVIKAIVKETGFLAGLYDDGELVSDNVKEKDDKIAFLNKLIDAVSKYCPEFGTRCLRSVFRERYESETGSSGVESGGRARADGNELAAAGNREGARQEARRLRVRVETEGGRGEEVEEIQKDAAGRFETDRGSAGKGGH